MRVPRAEKQSIVVNGELTPTIEVMRGQVLEVRSLLGLRACLCGTATCGAATQLCCFTAYLEL